MVPMHGTKVVGALHEPPFRPRRPHRPRPRLRGLSSRTRTSRRTSRFIVETNETSLSVISGQNKKKAPCKRTPLAEKQPVKLLHAVIVWHQECHRREARVKEHVTN